MLAARPSIRWTASACGSATYFPHRSAKRIAQRLECGRHHHHRGEIGIDGKRLEARGERAARARTVETRDDSGLIVRGKFADYAAEMVAIDRDVGITQHKN